MIRIVLALTILLGGCGFYLGDEGFFYLSEEFKGFLTADYLQIIEDDRLEVYEAGQNNLSIGPFEATPERGIAILGAERVAQITGGLTTAMGPYSWIVGLGLTILTALLKTRGIGSKTKKRIKS